MIIRYLYSMDGRKFEIMNLVLSHTSTKKTDIHFKYLGSLIASDGDLVTPENYKCPSSNVLVTEDGIIFNIITWKANIDDKGIFLKELGNAQLINSYIIEVTLKSEAEITWK
jgi:hypothetical protein